MASRVVQRLLERRFLPGEAGGVGDVLLVGSRGIGDEAIIALRTGERGVRTDESRVGNQLPQTFIQQLTRIYLIGPCLSFLALKVPRLLAILCMQRQSPRSLGRTATLTADRFPHAAASDMARVCGTVQELAGW